MFMRFATITTLLIGAGLLFLGGILSFAFISMLLSPVLCRFAAGEAVDFEQDEEGRLKSKRWSRLRAMTSIVMIGAGLLALAPVALAQSPDAGAGDPVARAMAKIESIVDDRAEAAGRALEASKLIKQSAEAKKQGDL